MTTTVHGGASCAPISEAMPVVVKDPGGATAQLLNFDVALKDKASREVSGELSSNGPAASTSSENICAAGLISQRMSEGSCEYRKVDL